VGYGIKTILIALVYVGLLSHPLQHHLGVRTVAAGYL